MKQIPWEELEYAAHQALRIRTQPILAAPHLPKALLVWIGERQGLIPASEVVGVGRIRAVDWMRLRVYLEGKGYPLKDPKEAIRIVGQAGSYFVALKSGDAQAVDGLGGFVDYEPRTLKPYPLRAVEGIILGKVKSEGARGGEAELLQFTPARSGLSF